MGTKTGRETIYREGYQRNGKQTTGTKGISSKPSEGMVGSIIGVMQHLPIYRLITIIILIGYIVIAFSGNMNDWRDIARYSFFIFISILIFFILYLIKTNLEYILNFIHIIRISRILIPIIIMVALALYWVLNFKIIHKIYP